MKHILIKNKQVLFFIIAGALSALVEISSMKLFSLEIPTLLPMETNWHGISYPLSNLLSTSCAITFNYFLSIWFVFQRGKHSKRREFAYFMFISFLSTILSLLFFNILFQYIIKEPIQLLMFALHPIILCKAIAIVVVSICNYSIKKKVIFNG